MRKGQIVNTTNVLDVMVEERRFFL